MPSKVPPVKISYPAEKSRTCIALDFSSGRAAILGSQYAGEMKKGLFSLMHYEMPDQGVLSLHSSATEGKDGDVTLMLGLSGTGKTTLITKFVNYILRNKYINSVAFVAPTHKALNVIKFKFNSDFIDNKLNCKIR